MINTEHIYERCCAIRILIVWRGRYILRTEGRANFNCTARNQRSAVLSCGWIFLQWKYGKGPGMSAILKRDWVEWTRDKLKWNWIRKAENKAIYITKKNALLRWKIFNDSSDIRAEGVGSRGRFKCKENAPTLTIFAAILAALSNRSPV